jgi:two-component system sensor histidine kinase UhpB
MQPLKTAHQEAEEIAILLIEDSPGDAAAITKALVMGETQYSFNVQRQPSLEAGLEYLSGHHIDVVLLDLGLPDAASLMALDAVHIRFPHMPIVIISGYSDMERVHAALRRGAQEFLVKGECSGAVIRQSIYQAIARKKIALAYEQGAKL